MDAEKALEYFKSGYDNLRTYQLTHSPTPETAILAPIYTAAIEALDKQVPKAAAVIKTNRKSQTFGDGNIIKVACPACGQAVTTKFCGNCGQAIKKG